MNNRPGCYNLTTKDAKPRSIKGGKAHALAMRWRIEDDFLTITEIAKVLKVSRDTARRRYKREADKPGPITWGGMTCK